MAKITLIGFENYLNGYNKSLFEKLALPEGIDKDTLTNNILLRAGEFETLYSNPDFLIDAISLWGKKYARTFTKWLAALNVEYNPLENYDRIEEWEEHSHNDGHTHDDSTNNGGINNENKVSAYDSDDYQPHDISSSLSNSEIHSDTRVDASNDNNHTGRIHGNIGVTTSQQMLQSELDIAAWNIYEHITDLFITEFCIMVY